MKNLISVYHFRDFYDKSFNNENFRSIQFEFELQMFQFSRIEIIQQGQSKNLI